VADLPGQRPTQRERDPMNWTAGDVANVGETVSIPGTVYAAMLAPGRNCAQQMYGADGWVMHHVTDIYGRNAINQILSGAPVRSLVPDGTSLYDTTTLHGMKIFKEVHSLS